MRPTQIEAEIDALPLEELVKPLSAKVMPASAKYSISGQEKPLTTQIRDQRKHRNRGTS